jgi:arylsulfatase A-like enzyme
MHTGHSTIRNNIVSFPLRANPADRTFLIALQEAGYHVDCIGKWHMGPRKSTGDPIAKGCTTFFGPESPTSYPSDSTQTMRFPAADGSKVWEGVPLPENYNASRERCMAEDSNCTWNHNLWINAAMASLTAHADRVKTLGAKNAPPLFMYLADTTPHAAAWNEHSKEAPLYGDPVPSDKQFNDPSWPNVERDHASTIVNYLDVDVGKLVSKLNELDMRKSTAFFFASDHGAFDNDGGLDYQFFRSSGPLRGRKFHLTEGGIRIPLSVSFPGVIPANVTSTFPTAFWDLGDTILDLAGLPRSAWLNKDGRSIKDVLTSSTGSPDPATPARDPLYWEFCTTQHPPGISRKGNGWGFAVRNETWKAFQAFLEGDESGVFLYNLADDIGETKDVAAQHPDIVAALKAYAKSVHIDSPNFPVSDTVCMVSPAQHHKHHPPAHGNLRNHEEE